jgi:hypothetical protein
MEMDEAAATPVAEKSASKSPGSSTASGGRKRKRTPLKAEVDDQQDTPGKRTRNPVKLFQSPAETDKTLA